MRLAICVKGSMLGVKRAKIIVDRFARRPIDADNAVAGCKPIVDALVTLGVLPDDHLKVMPHPPTVYQHQVRKGIVERSVILIEELEERQTNDLERTRESKATKNTG